MTEPGPDEIFRMSPGGRAVLESLLRALGTTAVLLVIYFLAPFDAELDASAIAWLLVGLVLAITVLVLQTRAIVRAAHPGLRAIEALGVSAPFFLLVFSVTYLLMAHNQPESFSQALSRVDALYFTMTVFATVGFGDIVARSQLARIIVTVQMAGDLILLGVGLRVITGAVRLGQNRRAAGVPARTRRRD